MNSFFHYTGLLHSFKLVYVAAFLMLSMINIRAQTTTIDFDGLGYSDNISIGGSTSYIGNFRFTYSEGKMFEHTNPVTVEGTVDLAGIPASNVAISDTGARLPHLNIKPFLAVNFIIALQRVFPSRN